MLLRISVRFNHHQVYKTFGPSMNVANMLHLEEWAKSKEIDLPTKILWHQFGKMDGSLYNNTPQKFLGVGITSTVLTDLLMKSLGDSLYNPLHFKALHAGLLSKTTLFNAADHLGMIPFLRYQLPFIPESSYKPQVPAMMAIFGIVGALDEHKGATESRKFIEKYIAKNLPKTTEQLEILIQKNAISFLHDIMNQTEEKNLFFKLLSDGTEPKKSTTSKEEAISVGAYNGVNRIGIGSGPNTITAKIKAAVNALENRVIYPKDNIMTILSK